MSIFSYDFRLAVSLIATRNNFIRNKYGSTYNYTTATQQSPAEYCLDMVRKYDYENFMCTLLLPAQTRNTAFAIRAFNIEVARVQDSVSEIRIGQMRMKFWEDVVESIYTSNVPKHPVALELYRATQRHKLSKRYLKRLIAMRSMLLSSSTLPTLETMETYAENSVSSIYYLLLEASGVQNVHADHAASHLGKAQGIVNLIRSVPHYAQRNIVALPQDVLLKHHVAEEQVLRANQEQPIRDAVFDVANRAKQHMDKARRLSDTFPKSVNILFLPAVTIDSYLERLRRTHFDVFDSSLQERNSVLPFVLYWNKIMSRY